MKTEGYFVGKYVKKNGVIMPSNLSTLKQRELFISNIPEDSVIDVFYEVTHDDGTLPQLAKLYVMLKKLATHIGETVENLKLVIKDRAGLCIAREVAGKEYFLAKSFSECSKEELSLAIQATIELGDQVGYPLN